MTKIESKLNARSADFQTNASAMRALVADLNQQFEQVALGGGEAARAKHTARGKLLPRDRVQMLLDPGTPFLELSPLAAHGMYDGAAPGAGGRPDRHRTCIRASVPDNGEAPATAGALPWMPRRDQRGATSISSSSCGAGKTSCMIQRI